MIRKKLGRGFGTNKGRRKGSVNKLKQWEKRLLAKNLLLAFTPLEMKFMIIMETEKFIQLCKVPLVRRCIALHGVNLKYFIKEHLDLNDANMLAFTDTLTRIANTPEGEKYKHGHHYRAHKRRK